VTKIRPAEPLTVAVRCHTEPGPGVCRHCWEPTGDRDRMLCTRCSSPALPPGDWGPALMLAFDCETTPDYAQALTFGFARLYRLTWHSGSVELKCIGEFCFHADELPQTGPEGYERLQAYCRGRLPALDEPLEPFPQALLWLMPRSEFVALLDDYAYRRRAMVVGFNLPFDISRLAVKWGAVDGRGHFYGGFRFVLSEVTSKKTGDQREPLWRPPIAIKPIDHKRALIGFLRPSLLNPGFEHHSGQFLDLHTTVRALTDESYSLKSAGETFKAKVVKSDADEHGRITPQYIEYARRDVAATASLFEAVMPDYLQDPIDLQPTRAFSAASRGKAHMRAMNVQPVLERQPDLPADVLGNVMTGYFGGRAEARIRRVPVPVTYLDFASMYPTVNVLMDLWHVMTAAVVEIVEEDSSKLRAWIDRRTVEDMFDPAFWPELRVFVQIKPNADVLPVRAAYGAGHEFNIAMNYYSSDETQWFALSDVIESKLITGRPPEIIRAIRLVPAGRQAGMRPITLRDGTEVDPYHDDFFRILVEQRNRRPNKNDSAGRGLKTTGNGTAYGIWAELNRVEQPRGRKLPVIVHGQPTFECETAYPERPGPYYFPPVAALIASGARLMLATLETLVTDADGTYAFCDTDSMAIVSSEHGGSLDYTDHTDTRRTIPVLSWNRVKKIVERFESLNPYDRKAVPGSILEIEKVNLDSDGNPRQLWTFPISAKRYALYTLTEGRPALVRVIDLDDRGGAEPADEPGQLDELADAKQHGLGHLLNPTDPESESRDWIGELWEYIVRTDALGQLAAEPKWLDLPAVGRFNVSNHLLLSAFNQFNRGKPHWQQVRPFNFLLVAHSGALDRGELTSRFLLVTRFERDPRKWARLRWVNVYDPERTYSIRAGRAHSTPGRAVVVVNTYRDVLAEYRVHPEAKSLGPDGQRCDKQTVGLLGRRHVTPILPRRHRGKEGHWIDQREAGVADPDATHTEYREPGSDPLWQLTVRVLRGLPVKQTAAGAGVSERTVERTRAGRSISKTARAKLTDHAVKHARAQLLAAGIPRAPDREALLATLLDRQTTPGPQPQLCGCGCGEPVPAGTRGRPRKYLNDTHRKRAARRAA
jgi:hypothetical protein